MAHAVENITSLDRFVENLPKKPYCTDSLGAGLRIRAKQIALQHRYIQFNPPHLNCWLVFDQDHDNYFQFETAQIATPNMIVRNKDNLKCHVFYAVVSVFKTEAARIKPLRFMAVVQEAYRRELQADAGYKNYICKNPVQEQSYQLNELHDHVYSLGELADYVDLDWSYLHRTKESSNSPVYGLGRNCILFDDLRYWAYAHVTHYRDNSTYEIWLVVVLEKAESLNTFPEPLPYSEIKATAKSVAKWTWTKYFYTGKVVRRGAMADIFRQSEMPMKLQTKQRLSARRTAEIKRDATREKIIDAIGQLTAANKRVTKAAVARIIGISDRAIRKNYSDLFIKK